MTDDSAESPRGGPPPGGGRPTGSGVQRRRFQGVVNRIARGLMRVPLLSRLAGNGLIILYVVGRRSGKRYAVPMAYLRHEGALLLGSGFAWGRNLRTGDAVEVDFKGERRVADVRVLTHETPVVEHCAVIARRNPGLAGFNGIGFLENGDPDPDDLRTAWATGARVLLLALR